MDNIKTGVTYSDVLLVPKKTALQSRSEADTNTTFTKNLSLKIPLVSANMATVTEYRTATAMAREGGLGIIHQFGTIEEQAEQVRKVKRKTSYIIENPIATKENLPLNEAISLMQKENVTSLLIKKEEELHGILTARDYVFEKNLSKPIFSLMTPKEKLITAEPGIDLEEVKEILQKNKIEKLPLLKNNRIVGLITTQDIKKLEYWPQACKDERGRLCVGAAVGVKDTLERATALVKAGADVIVLDTAHGHSTVMINRIEEIKQQLKVDVMAGNIATAEAAEELIAAGADGLKVGVGPGAACTTRIMSGSGVPQLTAVKNVCRIAKKHEIPVSADGGIKFPGDITKALAAGASTVFCGSLFAGTDETPGVVIMKNGKRFKKYMGSASYDSNHERKEHKTGKRVKERLNVFVEGVSMLVDYKGPLVDVINELVRGLRSGISYCGAKNIKEMQEKAEFIRITAGGWRESNAHGLKN